MKKIRLWEGLVKDGMAPVIYMKYFGADSKQLALDHLDYCAYIERKDIAQKRIRVKFLGWFDETVCPPFEQRIFV